MRVGSDLHRAVLLALVHEGVHVAHDGVADLVAGGAEEVDRADVRHLVDCRRERNRGAGQLRDAGAPHPAGDDRVLDLDRAPGGDDRPQAGTSGRPGFEFESRDLRPVQDRERAPRQGPLPHQRAGPHGVDNGHGRHPEAAQDDVRVHERDPVGHLTRGKELGVDAPRACRGHAAPQFLHPGLRAGNLDAAARRLHAERLVLALALQRQHRDLAAVVRGEDEVRRVAGGAAGVRKRALVDEDEVVPAPLREVLDEAVADDPGPDDGDARRGRLWRAFAHGTRCVRPRSLMRGAAAGRPSTARRHGLPRLSGAAGCGSGRPDPASRPGRPAAPPAAACAWPAAR